jgi:predicted  nucleic acid-binding Zn-ribbon protein
MRALQGSESHLPQPAVVVEVPVVSDQPQKWRHADIEERDATIAELRRNVGLHIATIIALENKLNADSQNFQIECQKAEIERLTAKYEQAKEDAVALSYQVGDVVRQRDAAKAEIEEAGKHALEQLRERREIEARLGRIADLLAAHRPDEIDLAECRKLARRVTLDGGK